MKTIGYLCSVLLILTIGYALYGALFTAKQTITPHHETLALTPFTPHEQQALTKAQQSKQKKPSLMPPTAQTNIEAAQAAVLNIKD